MAIFIYLCSQAVRHIYGDLYETVDYPARGFAFQLYGHTVNSMARCTISFVLQVSTCCCA